MRFALFVITAIALWHSAGISSRGGGSASCSTSVACVRVCVVRVVSAALGVLAFGLESMFLAAFLSLEMRFSCLVSDFVMRGCSLGLCGFVVVVSLAISIGQGGGSYRWSLLPFSPLCLFGR